MRRLLLIAALCACVLVAGSGIAFAQFPSGYTFIQADITNTQPAVAGTDWWSGSDAADNKWANTELEWADSTFVWQFVSKGSTIEDCPTIKTSPALDPASVYRVYVVFRADAGRKIQAGANPSALATYDSSSSGAIVVDAGSNTVMVPVAQISGNSVVYINDGDGAFSAGASYIGLACEPLLFGQFGTFVQASADNTAAADGSSAWYTTTSADDNKWNYDPCPSLASLLSFYSVGSWHEDCPVIKTTVTGLDPTKPYNVYVIYDALYFGSVCTVQAGLGASSIHTFPTQATVADPAHPVSIPTPQQLGILVGKVGVFSGSDTLSLFVNDGDYTFGQGARYIGLAYEVLDLPNKIDYSDEVVVDGNMNDWADADWKPFDQTYDATPSDIADGSAWAVKWGAGGTRVYIAAKVNDTAHFFTDSYTGWNARDAVEFYLNTTGGDTGPYGANNYPQFQEQAQEWTIGVKQSNHNSAWATCGYPPSFGNYTPSDSELKYAGKEGSEWLYYEAALTPFEYFGGRRGNPSVVSPLHTYDVIRTDVVAVGHNFSDYTGAKTSGHSEPGWSQNYNLLARHMLVRNGVKGTITLIDFASSTLGVAATVVITDSLSVSETHNVVLDASGNYSFKTALNGICTATASTSGYVPQSLPVLVTSGNGDVSFILNKQVSIIDAKKKPLGVVAGVAGCVTAVFDGSIYVESRDRISGIRVDKPNHGMISGDIGKNVYVTGTVEEDPSTHEIYISAGVITTNILSDWYWPGTFVQATTGNTVAADAGAWYAATFTEFDGLWSPDNVNGLGFLFSQGSWKENTPMLKTTVTGLTASSTYQVYVVYDKGYDGSGYNMVAGLDPSAMTWFTGPTGDCRAMANYAVFSSPIGSVKGVTSLSVYADDGENTFGQGARYVGLVYSEVLQPLGMTNKSLGGGNFINSATGDGQVGVVGGAGLNNIGLLVRTTGLASGGDSSGFTLNDGSGVALRVSLADAGTAYDGKYVTVMGISSIDSAGARAIKTRSPGDVLIVN